MSITLCGNKLIDSSPSQEYHLGICPQVCPHKAEPDMRIGRGQDRQLWKSAGED